MENEILIERLKAQANEADYQGLKKLANIVFKVTDNIGVEELSSASINDKAYEQLWAVAANIISMHGVHNVNIEKIDEEIIRMAEKVVDGLEIAVCGEIRAKGENEERVPGEK
jgi:hypothetical protein